MSKPYADFKLSQTDASITIEGQGFGAAAGQVTLDGVTLPVTSWSDSSIQVTMPAGSAAGPHQLQVVAANGERTVNGLTFHVLGYGPFPSSLVLDNFNRSGIGNNWNANNAFTLNANSIRVTGTGTMRWRGSAGGGPVYGANQEAYFTFLEVSPTASEQGLFLKVTGNGNNPDPLANGSAYIEVSYKATAPTAVQVRTKANGTNTVVLHATFAGVTFAAGNKLGARVLEDGTVIAYKDGVPVGSVNVAGSWPAAKVSGGGRLGVRFVGAQNNTTNDARFDDFGGGTAAGYIPAVYEVGPGKTYDPTGIDPNLPPYTGPIQAALDAAASSPQSDLVVVYPGAQVQWNPNGVYFENLLVYAPIKLQGVGPGGVRANGTFVPGSVIDGRGLAGDTPYADAWLVKLQGIPWDGNQAIYEGPVVSILAEMNEFVNAFKASIDGFTIQGGDQQGFPNQLGAIDPTLKEAAAVQGGGIFANAYARFLQITNNILQSNGGAYAGAIRLGTPHLPGALNDNQNDFVRIANNRILANGGTNLAGAIGLFSGSEGYEVAFNDICGNFSAEYGGGISHYGLSPNGKIHDNRVYFNRAYDEAGGIMIAGELPADPTVLTPGAGSVDVYNNLIQANLSNDDGGGLRFLMSGNFPYNVYNNMIVNNVSTHEGGGVSINDAPDVRLFNNTIMKNLTTATAVTSNGQPAPAGLSSSRNSDLLQATLAGGVAGCGQPGNAPCFSDPLLFNNIFWDNRAGWFTPGTGVQGLGLTDVNGIPDPNPINFWDLGIQDQTIGQLSPTNSVLQTTFGTIADGTNVGTDPQVASVYDTSVAVLPWRGNPNFVDTLLVAVDVPVGLMGDYHIQAGSSAIDAGAPGKGAVVAPAFDFDRQARPYPAGGAFDIGADEDSPLQAILATANEITAAFSTYLSFVAKVWTGQP